MSKLNANDIVIAFLNNNAGVINTIKTYASILRCYQKWLEANKKNILEVRKYDVLGFLDQYTTPRTYNISAVVLALFYRWLVDREYLPESPIKDIKKRKVPHMLPDPLTEAEVKVLLDKTQDEKYRIPILLMLYSGLRASEALSVTKKDFWNENGIMMLKITGKGAKEREVYVSNDKAKGEIGKYVRKLKPEDKLSDITLNTIEGYAKMIKEHIKNFHLHRLRKTFACNLANQNVPAETIKLLLGHSKWETTEIYTKFRLNRNNLIMV